MEDKFKKYVVNTEEEDDNDEFQILRLNETVGPKEEEKYDSKEAVEEKANKETFTLYEEDSVANSVSTDYYISIQRRMKLRIRKLLWTQKCCHSHRMWRLCQGGSKNRGGMKIDVTTYDSDIAKLNQISPSVSKSMLIKKYNIEVDFLLLETTI